MPIKKIMLGVRIPIEIHKKLKMIAARKYCSLTYAIIEMVLKEEGKYGEQVNADGDWVPKHPTR